MSEDPAVHWATEQEGLVWSWVEPSRGEHFRRCSYCGSIHPDDLVAETLWRPIWADMKYGWPHKFYVNIANREPEQLFVIGSAYGRTFRERRTGEVAWADLTDEQRALVERDLGPLEPDLHRLPDTVWFGFRSVHSAKFYSTHLGDPAITPEVKAEIERVAGVRLTFQDGLVCWERTGGAAA